MSAATVAEVTTTDRATSAQWRALGTEARLVVTDAHALDAALSIADAELAAVDLTCSRFRDDSELRRLDDANGVPQPISPLLTEALQVALRAARLTDGDVDPTVGSAMHANGYDRDFAELRDDGLAVTSVSRPDWRSVQLDTERGVLRMPAGTRLDLGATAKAWAADRIAAVVAERLGCGVLVSLGGDVSVAGAAPEGGWVVRVQDVTGTTDDEPDGPSATVVIERGGLATSGVAARRWTKGGRAMHHIVDPRTTLPAVTPWLTVSVAAGSCLDANIASTAAITRGKAALPWLRTLELPARFVATDGAVLTVAGWPEDRSP